MTRILFVGETWKGSSARSLCEALTKIPELVVDEIGEDQYLPRYRSLFLRVVNRLIKPWQILELRREIFTKINALKPDVLMIYKGSGVAGSAINSARHAGIFVVNVFPDYSPHAYGDRLQAAMGEYDLVVSTKPFHPDGWGPIYGYSNPCVCVPHGYDPAVHYWSEPPDVQDFDVVIAASWRPQYETLMKAFCEEMQGQPVRVGLAGSGWVERRSAFPTDWEFAGPLYGRAYGEWLRRGKIVIAPVHREVVINGIQQPGDEDTTRTYELASSGCFFLHRRTPFAQTLYDEQTEVPMWDSPQELADLVKKFLPLDERRRAMAAAAHRRAVPAYSVPSRAAQVLDHVRDGLLRHRDKLNVSTA
ncbi:glycosyltransferase [Polaromonas sp. P1-6]|nr:glycosyltransferase [Polaromonas sp. P1-6]